MSLGSVLVGLVLGVAFHLLVVVLWERAMWGDQ